MSSKVKRQRLVFSEKLMFSFIHDYKESGCLWDIKHRDYKCAEKRRAALSQLAAKYDITEEEAKRKLNSLRSTYLQEKKKVEESKKSGGEVYQPSLYWFHELDFLFDVIIPRKTPHHLPSSPDPPTPPQPPSSEQCQVTQPEQHAEEVNPEEVDQEHLIFEFVPDANEKTIFTQKLEPESFAVQPSSSCGTVRTLKRRGSLKKPSLSIHQQHFNDHVDVQPTRVQVHDRSCHSPQPSSIVQHEDEFDKFCCSIASQLRTLPPIDAIEMQLEIQQLVSRRRLAVLKNQQNLTILRNWDNANGYHQYHTQPTVVDHDSGQEERSEKLILGQ